MSTPMPIVGIDAGATLCKLALCSERLQTALFPSNQLEAALKRVSGWGPGKIVATGGGAARLGSRVAGIPVQQVSEFEAWARGAPLLARREHVSLPERYLLVSLGTGTSVLAVDGEKAERIGGTALGGGTLLGLGRLLLGAESFGELAGLAERGDRREVDLLVGDIYREGVAPLASGITAASFGKLASTRREDLAHALMGLVAENVGLICTGLGQARPSEAVVYGGATLSRNPVLQEILEAVTRAFGGEAHFLVDGAFCGAVGAAALASP